MLQHVKNYRNKRERILHNLQEQVRLITAKEQKLAHQKSELVKQQEKVLSELALTDDEIDELIISKAIRNNKKLPDNNESVENTKEEEK